MDDGDSITEDSKGVKAMKGVISQMGDIQDWVNQKRVRMIGK